LSKFFEATKTGVLYFSLTERLFLEQLQKYYGTIVVKMMDFDVGHQLKLELYIDTNSLPSRLQAQFETQLTPGYTGGKTYCCSHSENPKDELALFSNNAMELFAKTFHYHISEFSDFYLVLCDIYTYSVCCMKALATAEIMEILLKRIPNGKFKLPPVYRGSLEYYLVVTGDMYEKLNQPSILESISHDIFLAIKKHDKFDYMKEEKVKLILYNKDKTKAEDLHVDPREWLY